MRIGFGRPKNIDSLNNTFLVVKKVFYKTGTRRESSR